MDSAPEMSVERSVLPDNLLLERAVRLMRAEMERVESKNQLETYLRAFEVSVGLVWLLIDYLGGWAVKASTETNA